MYFEARSSLKFQWPGIKGGSFRGAWMVAMVPTMQFLAVFSAWGSPVVVKIGLFVCQGFPRNLQLILLKSLVETDLEVPWSDRFFHDEGSLRNHQTVSTSRLKFPAIIWREVSFALFLMNDRHFFIAEAFFTSQCSEKREKLFAWFTQKTTNLKLKERALHWTMKT